MSESTTSEKLHHYSQYSDYTTYSVYGYLLGIQSVFDALDLGLTIPEIMQSETEQIIHYLSLVNKTVLERLLSRDDEDMERYAGQLFTKALYLYRKENNLI